MMAGFLQISNQVLLQILSYVVDIEDHPSISAIIKERQEQLNAALDETLHLKELLKRRALIASCCDLWLKRAQHFRFCCKAVAAVMIRTSYYEGSYSFAAIKFSPTLSVFSL